MSPDSGRSDKIVSLDGIRAVIFDMDGVVTDTAWVHASAWKRLFDEYLEARSRREGTSFRPFDINDDYYRYVDGKPRYDGVQSFLESRGILLPYGYTSDPSDRETVCGLGNRKNEYFQETLREQGVVPYGTTLEFVRRVRDSGTATAVISASRNCAQVLRAAGVESLFDVRVDGVVSDEIGLKGKPAPDIFLEAVRRLGVGPQEAVVVEDALAGVEAGRRGGFALVVGVDRLGHGDEMKKRGADLVVGDLSEVTVLAPKSGQP